MKRQSVLATVILLVAVAWGGSSMSCAQQEGSPASLSDTIVADTMRQDSATAAAAERMARLREDSIAAVRADSLSRYDHLTEEDFKLVAEELGIEVAAIKAVVSIEAGAAMKGFWAPGVPIVNFDPTMYRKYASKAPDKSPDKNAKVPSGLKGYALKEWTQLTNARKKNAQGADMGTFWGMFQIGGFNYKLCGCNSVKEFVDRMSYSELEQLELFAKFIVNVDYLKYLKEKNWTAFARRYNGPSYAKRKYHTRMAQAYAKFKKEEESSTK